MNIILFLSSLDCGGAERVGAGLCDAWAKKGHNVTLVTTAWGSKETFYNITKEVNVIRLSNLEINKNYVSKISAIKKIIQQKKPDVVISFLPNVNIQLLLARFLCKFKLIICERSDPTVQPIGIIFSIACKLMYWRSSAIVVQTKAVKFKIGDYFWGKNKIYDIPNPIPDGLHGIYRKEISNTIIYLGRFSVGKNVIDVVKAFHNFSQRNKDWQLKLYGEGACLINIKEFITKNGIEEKVKIMGGTSDPWDKLSSASIFVMASSFEGFPNALLEAMAIGLPCISTDCPSGPSEITENGKHAMLVPVNNIKKLSEAMNYLANNDDIRYRLGCEARNHVLSEYAMDKIILRWDQVFRELA